MSVTEKELAEELPKTAGKQLEPVLTVRFDVGAEGKREEGQIHIFRDRIEVCDSSGLVVRRVEMAQVEEARLVTSVGGGALLADTEDGPVALARFTSVLNGRMGFAVKTIQAIVKKEALLMPSEKDTPKTCPTCQSRLPDGTNVVQLVQTRKK